MIRVTPPATPIVALADAKAHLRVDHAHEDALIQAYLDAATSWVDGFDGVLGRCVMPQTWQASVDEIAAGIVVYDVTATVENQDGSANYTCAMPAEKVPSVKAAILLLVGYWYEQRQASVEGNWSEAPLAVKALLAPLRVWA